MTSVLVCGLGLLAVATPSEEFARGRTAFFRAEYRRAIQILQPLLYPDLRLETEADVVQAHRMLGVAHLFENEPTEARLEFKKLLELRPDYRFDPLLDPPRVVDFFNDLVKQQQSELVELEARRKKREAELASRRHAEAIASGAVVVQRMERHSRFIAFVPFGAGQFQNGQRRKGWMFLGVEGTLAAVSVGALVTNFALYGASHTRDCLDPVAMGGVCPPDRVSHSGESLSKNLVRTQVATGIAFYAVAIWGVIDALRNFQEEVPLALAAQAADHDREHDRDRERDAEARRRSWRFLAAPTLDAPGAALTIAF